MREVDRRGKYSRRIFLQGAATAVPVVAVAASAGIGIEDAWAADATTLTPATLKTLVKVARCIVQRQTSFFEIGEEAMEPLILKDVAEAVEMHESTISRVTSGKYMHTPRGVFELRYFFSSQVEGADGSGTSSTAIRAKIRKLVKEEDPESPLSDGRIAEMLSGEGIPVARRTVAKYREAMGIAPSNERRRAGLKQL